MPDPSLTALEAELIDLARNAGRIAVDLREQGLTVAYKDDDSPTTNVDITVETLIREQLRNKGHRFRFLGEESQETASDGILQQIIVDGIDGTRNFRDGNFGWCTSIAVRDGAEIVLAVMHDEYSQLTYTARKGGGAAILSARGRTICKVPETLPHDFSFSVGSFRVAGSLEKKQAIIADIKRLGGRQREWGCVSLSICAVARGGLGAFIQCNSKVHDHAAAVLFAEEAGAIVRLRPASAELVDVVVAHPSHASRVLASLP